MLLSRHTRRRKFVTLLGGSALTWPFAARAQQSAMPVVGFLPGGTSAGAATMLAAFRKGLSETGFTEGRNVTIEFRWGLDSRDRQTEAAAEMVRRKVDVIVAPGFSVAALAARR
jgi:putative tryptophan/tyrosine transport system substrate-binding protein